MLDCFSFLGEDKAKEIVVTNTHKIASLIGDVHPVKDDLYTPKIEGADDETRDMSYVMARSIVVDELPEIVEARLEKELKSIIGHGFAVIYLISHKLVKKSLVDGYLVGFCCICCNYDGNYRSKSITTTLCMSNCKQSEFFNDGSVGSGFDLPDKECPTCNVPYVKDGIYIPLKCFSLDLKGIRCRISI